MTEINLEPFNFSSAVTVLKKVSFKYGLIFLILIIFIGCLYYARHPFSNQQILYIISNKDNSNISLNTKCIGFTKEDNINLIYQLNSLLDDKAYFKGNTVKPIYFENLPENIDNLTNSASIQIRKQVFIKAILPIIIKSNMEVKKDHDVLVSLLNKMPKEDLSKNDINTIVSLANKYNVTIGNNNFWDYLKTVNLLLVKVNIIPNSLVLAVAIQETGWGKSRFLKEGNSLFSEWTFNHGTKGIIPIERDKNKNYKVKVYDDLSSSAQSFFMNINSSDTYKQFRDIRIKMINKGTPLNSYILADALNKYSEGRGDYVEALRSIIKYNNLVQYDKYDSVANLIKPMCIYFY
ncbi:glucosaminidase domain-containing protein [Rickettsiales bacterium LUAb2]